MTTRDLGRIYAMTPVVFLSIGNKAFSLWSSLPINLHLFWYILWYGFSRTDGRIRRIRRLNMIQDSLKTMNVPLKTVHRAQGRSLLFPWPAGFSSTQSSQARCFCKASSSSVSSSVSAIRLSRAASTAFDLASRSWACKTITCGYDVVSLTKHFSRSILV